MEMQEQVTQNDIVYDEAHDVENDNEELKSEREDSDNIEEGLPILIHVERIQGGPVISILMQKDLIGKIVNAYKITPSVLMH